MKDLWEGEEIIIVSSNRLVIANDIWGARTFEINIDNGHERLDPHLYLDSPIPMNKGKFEISANRPMEYPDERFHIAVRCFDYTVDQLSLYVLRTLFQSFVIGFPSRVMSHVNFSKGFRGSDIKKFFYGFGSDDEYS